MKRSVLIVGGAFVVSASVMAADVDKPWARWICSPETIATANQCQDATGGGHVLNLGANLLPMSQHSSFQQISDMRGDVLTTTNPGSGATYATFACPTLGSRTFAVWVKMAAANHTYDTSDLVCLLNWFSGMSIFQKRTENVWRVGFGQALRVNQFFGPQMEWITVLSEVQVYVPRKMWQHLVFSLEDTGTRVGDNGVYNLFVYRNGELAASQSGIVAPVGKGGEAVIGNVGSWCTSPISGQLDDIRVYEEALSGAEARELYERTRTRKLLAHWPMDQIVEKDGVRLSPDVSGNGADLTLASLVKPCKGVLGDGLFFDSGDASVFKVYDSYAMAKNTTGLRGEGDWSIAFWMKRDRRQRVGNAGRLLMVGPMANILLVDGSNQTERNLTIAQLNDSTETDRKVPCMGRMEEWVHVALVFEYGYGETSPGQTGLVGRVVGYQNGRRVTDDSFAAVADAGFTANLAKDVQIVLGNHSNKCKPFWGTLDDVYWYAGRLSEDEVQSLYRGPADVSAGEDFSVVGETAVLTARISPYPATLLASGYQGEPVWRLVRAPAGGEDAVIKNDRAASTQVSLPVVGTYVFAIANEVNGIVCEDEVSVTRLANPMQTAPTVSIRVVSQTGLCVVVEATVSGTERVMWRCGNGPGAAWFGHPGWKKTVVTFAQEGTYELVCTANGPGGETSATVSVDVAGDGILTSLDTGLGVYWPFDVSEYGEYIDRKRNLHMTGGADNGYNYGYGLHVEPGVAGGYSIYVGSNPPAQLETVASSGSYKPWDNYHPDYPQDGSGVPAEPYNTISCWLYHDSADTNNVWKGTICQVGYSCEVSYLCDGGLANDFSIVQNRTYQQPLRFKGLEGLNYTNRWIHLVAQIDNHGTGGSEVWVNGVKLNETTGQLKNLGLGRTCNAFVWGGGGYDYPPNDSRKAIANMSSKKFPGYMDEIRMYRRKLSETEIRYLYEYPVPTAVNQAPDVVIPVPSIQMPKRVTVNVAASSSDDGLPVGGGLTYEWRVTEGDPSGLVLMPGEGAAVTVLGRTSGQYKLQLVVFDGERKTYADPIDVNVQRSGSVIMIR